MEIKLIKTRAKDVLKKNKEGMVRVSLVAGLLTLIPSFFAAGANENNQITWISLILSVICLPFIHGFVQAGLMMITGKEDDVDEKIGIAGVKRWKKLISTYFLMAFYVFLYSFIPAIVLSVILFIEGTFTVFGIVVAVVLALIMIDVSLKITLAPYLLEDYGFKNGQAINGSRQLMKGHVFDLIKLFLSYLPWMIVQGAAVTAILYFLTAGLPIIVVAVIDILAFLLIGTYTYFPSLALSLAVFYKELAYHAYH